MTLFNDTDLGSIIAADGGDVPEGWANARLDDVAELVSGAGFPDRYQGKQGLPLPFFKVGNLADVESGGSLISSGHTIDEATARDLGARILPAGSIAFAKIGMAIRLNRRRFLGVPACVDNNVMAAVPTEAVTGQYLLRFLECVDFMPLTQATTVPSLRKTDLAQIPIPLPPLAEQKRIAAKVEAVLAKASAAQQRLAKVPAILKRFRQSVLAAACSGRLTENWRDEQAPAGAGATGADQLTSLRAGHSAKGTARAAKGRRGANAATYNEDGLDVEAMPELPESWAYGRADEIVEPGTVVTYGIVLPGPQRVEGVPYVRGLDIENGRILVEQLWRTAPEIAAKHERSRLRPGDVLLCIIRHLKVAIVPAALDGGNLTQGTVRLRPSAAIVSEFLAKYLESDAAQEWMKRRYFGMDMPRINVEDARAIPVPLPPLSEQHEIVRRVSTLFALADKVEARLAAATAAVERVTRAVLAKAFRGELVETEASLARREGRDYEPAAKLLERVRATASASATAKGVAKTRRPRRTTSSEEIGPC